MDQNDENCRLRNGLNVHCLAHIFQYLHTPDLFVLGGMNDYYKEIINNLVISKHQANFVRLFNQNISVEEIFERYGTKIQNFFFVDRRATNTIDQLVQCAEQYCSIDQLKIVKIYCGFYGEFKDLPIQFKNVKHLEFNGFRQGEISMQLSDSLQYLNLSYVNLNSSFDWTQLKSLKELYLDSVNGIEADKFIDLICQRPKLEVFHHSNTFGDFTQDVCDAMGKYCGNYIRDYSGAFDYPTFGAPTNHVYDFISGFKNVKKIHLVTHQFCGGDLIDAIRRLAENNTVEELEIVYSGFVCIEEDFTCIFQDRPNLGRDMKQFTHLKTVKISGIGFRWDDSLHGQMCDTFKILNVYGSQILSNVEDLTIQDRLNNWDSIKFAKKLRYLHLSGMNIDTRFNRDEAVKIVSVVDGIIRERNDGSIIKLICIEPKVLQLLAEITGCHDFIKLSTVQGVLQTSKLLDILKES